MEDLSRYKHYILLLAALLVLNFIVVPLFSLQDEQLENLRLLERRLEKTERLIKNKDNITGANEILAENESLIPKYAYLDNNVDTIKLSIQKIIKSIITQSGCDFERIIFRGNEKLSDKLSIWAVELRYKGDLNCLMSVTREIESNSPLIIIKKYSYNSSALNDNTLAPINAKLSINFFQYISNEGGTEQ
ncbi:hypothetical protein Q4493_00955 [Colwellia sp. 1_MG-2023]|uniref:hypothetical protein n=1 Tax=Colwellia sp. 1_MG-2023 TaxID=3062649 RepID=UPI0026E32ECE|nr:hypothetical protein [Colwellia sp. 1_MG-2023]MDO6444332.1 hypothetical protein [Colwellia sp. 1_MG-2023]